MLWIVHFCVLVRRLQYPEREICIGQDMRLVFLGLTAPMTKPLQRRRFLSKLRRVALQITNPNGLLVVRMTFIISRILFDALHS